ncbi:MAG: acetate--CoA ligase family protein [Deltaproteobacteria bacterium]|nr:acetate--CoA ligase family protein [Deltaproteobacteria bacterium]
MLTKNAKDLLRLSSEQGWVLEPDSKRILATYGIKVPRFIWAKSPEEATIFAGEIGYPVVAKVVSPQIMHKSDSGGVVPGIENEEQLGQVYNGFAQMEGFAWVLVEEMVSGIELMAGAKVDYQFGPIILFGMGGTAVEIYKDITIRMAPVTERDAISMVRSLKAHPLLEGYRGTKPINLEKLTQMLKAFLSLVMDIHQDVESIDLNPIMCTARECVVADARIVLKGRDE